jgi:hypothetical protein
VDSIEFAEAMLSCKEGYLQKPVMVCVPDSNKQYPLTIDQVRKIQQLNAQALPMIGSR